jgi:hypothetical protein
MLKHRPSWRETKAKFKNSVRRSEKYWGGNKKRYNYKLHFYRINWNSKFVNTVRWEMIPMVLLCKKNGHKRLLRMELELD